MSPEQIKGAHEEQSKYTNAIDIFALGVVAYEIMTLKLGQPHGGLILAGEENHFQFLLKDMSIYKDEELTNTVLSMLKVEPSERPTASELVQNLKKLNGK
jgi:serine/threonine protein kinase